jgi:hypothetical protein
MAICTERTHRTFHGDRCPHLLDVFSLPPLGGALPRPHSIAPTGDTTHVADRDSAGRGWSHAWLHRYRVRLALCLSW